VNLQLPNPLTNPTAGTEVSFLHPVHTGPDFMPRHFVPKG
jgi:hypothetical protein